MKYKLRNSVATNAVQWTSGNFEEIVEAINGTKEDMIVHQDFDGKHIIACIPNGLIILTPDNQLTISYDNYFKHVYPSDYIIIRNSMKVLVVSSEIFEREFVSIG